MTQPELFSVSEVGERIVYPPVRPGHKNRATAAPVGTGPPSETCKTCRFYERITYHDKTYLKCDLTRAYWTHGPGSDIKAKYPACREWRPTAERLAAIRVWDGKQLSELTNDEWHLAADWLAERGDPVEGE